MLQLFFTLVNDLCNKHTRNVNGFLFITEFEKVTLFSHNEIMISWNNEYIKKPIYLFI